MNTFNDLKTKLSEDDISAILSIVGYRCREKTIRRLRSMLTYGTNAIPTYGIFGRLTRESDGSWSYCAGQSYPDEIRTLRECILNK